MLGVFSFENTYEEKVLFYPTLPPIFDVYDDAIVGQVVPQLEQVGTLVVFYIPQIMPKVGLDEFSLSLISKKTMDTVWAAQENCGNKSETMNIINPELDVVCLTFLWNNKLHYHVFNGIPRLVHGFNEFGQRMVRGGRLCVNNTTTMCLHMQVCVWNQQQMFKVFDPGTPQRIVEIGQQMIDIPTSHLDIGRHKNWDNSS